MPKLPCRLRATPALARTDGLSTVEYVLILCLIAIVGLAAWRRFGATVVEKVNAGTTHVDTLQNHEH